PHPAPPLTYPLSLHDALPISHDLTSGYQTRSMLCTPIKNRSGKVVGVLQLLNKIDGLFGKADLDFLDAISDHMAIAMENATLHLDRKSTRLNSSHLVISYAVF